MKTLKSYEKSGRGEKVKQVVTSVNITQEQKIFLEKHNLNLSDITRDAIDELRKSRGEA